MFRSQAHPCYPESDQQDGCYPDNAALPSRFMCWVIGSPGQAGPRRRDRGGEGSPDHGSAALSPGVHRSGSTRRLVSGVIGSARWSGGW
jgi:hypothetical protein